jgi:hypothetical protein
MKSFKFLFPLLFAAFFFGGCYTVVWNSSMDYPTEENYNYTEDNYYDPEFYGDMSSYYYRPWWLTVAPPTISGVGGSLNNNSGDRNSTFRNESGGRNSTNTHGTGRFTTPTVNDSGTKNSTSTTPNTTVRENKSPDSSNTNSTNRSSGDSGSRETRNNDSNRNSGGRR